MADYQYSGASMAMPILVINMGGEMVYILAQRLRAQNVAPEKSTKVLGDVIKTMYYPKFIEELFKPQMMYSKQSVREIFHKLAHSSIMRLNESSMEKLFDLMAMGVKYQVIRAACPRDLIAITMNHLNTLQQIVGPGEPYDLLENCKNEISMKYEGTMSNADPHQFTQADLQALRHVLAGFFQDRKVKVSLFLQDGRQFNDGSLAIPAEGYLAPGVPHGETVGMVKYDSTESKAPPPPPANGNQVPNQQQNFSNNNMNNFQHRSAPPRPRDAEASKKELNALADLIHVDHVNDDFKLNLDSMFGNFDMGDSSGPNPDSMNVHTVKVGGNQQYQQHLQSAGNYFDDTSGQGQQPYQNDEDDLLAMMDSAVQ